MIKDLVVTYRKPIVVLAVVFGVTLSTLLVLNVNADNSRSPGDDGGQITGRGIFRGVTTAARFDISPPLRTMTGTGTRVKEERERSEFEDLVTGLEGTPGPQDIDPLVQSTTGPLTIPTPSRSFDSAISCGGCAPPDPVGDVGPNHYVAMGNSQFQVFNKSGVSLFGPADINSLWSGFGGPCQDENAGDPVAIYDQLDDRWILTQFTANGPTYFTCFAISTSPDPTGSYFRYAISTGTNFPDYPKYGMWGDALYISTREFGDGGTTFAGIGAYAVNREQLVAGNPSVQVLSFLATPESAGGMFNIGDGLLPTDIDGSTLHPVGARNYFIGSMDNGASFGAPRTLSPCGSFMRILIIRRTRALLLRVLSRSALSIDTGVLFGSCLYIAAEHGKQDRPPWLPAECVIDRAAYRNFGGFRIYRG